jgi:hypothetical protein
MQFSQKRIKEENQAIIPIASEKAFEKNSIFIYHKKKTLLVTRDRKEIKGHKPTVNVMLNGKYWMLSH